jgi:hypothetical protein
MVKRAICLIAILATSAMAVNPGLRVPNEPSFLEPVKSIPGEHDHYLELVSTALTGGQKAEFGVVVRPSFALEYSVILTTTREDDSARTTVTALQYATVSKQLSYLMSNYSGRPDEEIIKDAGVTRKWASIPDSAAEFVRKAWKAMLDTLQAPNPNVVIADGVVYEYFMGSDKRGTTHSPRSGACKMLVDLSDLLVKYVTSEEAERPAILRKVVALSQRVEKAAPSGMEIAEPRK